MPKESFSKVWNSLNKYMEKFFENNLSDKKQVESLSKAFKNKRSDVGRLLNKKAKDPNAPKKNVSAYIHFATEQHGITKEENPEMSSKDVMKLLGSKWKELTDKSRYVSIATEDKLRYEKEMKEYTPPEEFQQEKPKKGGFKNAFNYYMSEQSKIFKAENKNMKSTDTMKEAGKRWRSLTDEEKQPYKDMAERHKKGELEDLDKEEKEETKERSRESDKDVKKEKRERKDKKVRRTKKEPKEKEKPKEKRKRTMRK